jgi:hypothetical protein
LLAFAAGGTLVLRQHLRRFAVDRAANLAAWVLDGAAICRPRDSPPWLGAADQTIIISEATVSIEDLAPPAPRRIEFPRHWAQVRIRPGGSPLHPSRLTVESHGRRHEIGSFLNEQERLGLAKRLKRLIGRMDESPPLTAQGGPA